MATIDEKFDSREATVLSRESVELRYVVQGTEDDADVKTLVAANAPLIYAGLPRKDFQIRPQGGGIWEATVRYSLSDPNRTQDPPQTGDSRFSFDTGGGTQHITQSLETVASYAVAGPPPDFQGAIGVSHDAVEGTDVTVPIYHFSETHYIDNALVTGAYKASLFFLTGKTNDAPFKGFEEGEVLFLGASGSKRGDEDWEISFRFAASPNVTGLSVGPINGISKKGWEYLWVRYADAEDQNTLIKRPVAVYIERVYEAGDFTALGIGT
jgi:hypothetical protein